MIRLYVSAAVLAVATLAWWRYDSVADERNELKTALSAAAAAIEQKDGIIAKERSGVAEAAARAEANLQEKKAIENEAKTMRACIADKSCGVRVDWKFKVCPGLPSTNTGGSRIDGSAEPDTRNMEEWVVSVEESIKLNLLHIESLQNDIKIRADPDYCKPLKQ